MAGRFAVFDSLRVLASRLRGLLTRRRLDEDFQQELDSHLALLTEENVRRGMAPEDAGRAARVRLGGVTQLRETNRDLRGLPWLETLVQDVRYGLRQLRRSPGFTTAAVVTLALGIGANTALFSLIDAVLLRMLPVTSPERLVHLFSVTADGGTNDYFSYPTYKTLRDQNHVFSDVFAFRALGDVDFEVDGHGELAQGQAVTGNYHAVLGRTINPADDRVRAGSPVAVISYRYWERRFGRDPSVLDKNIVLDNVPFRVIGVTAPEFFGLEPGQAVDVWIPLAEYAQIRPGIAAIGTPYDIFEAAYRNSIRIMARLKPGVTEAKAQADLAPIFQQALQRVADSLIGLPFDSPQGHKLLLTTRLEVEAGGRGLASLRERFSKPLLTLTAVVGLLLLIACTNVAGLLLVRAAARQREIAIRVALGAPRRRLIRQLITESVMLAFAGGVLGLLLAHWGSNSLVALMSHSAAPVLLNVRPDARVLAFTLIVSLATALLFGLAPALRASRLDVSPATKESVRTLGAVGRQARLGKILAITQVALSLVMLITAGLLVRSLANLRGLYPGFNQDRVLLVSVNPTLVGYTESQIDQLYAQVLERIRAIPGVRSASFSMSSPLGQSSGFTDAVVEGYTPSPGEHMVVQLNLVGPGYFRTLETAVLAGREFNDADAAGAPKVAVINQAMSRRFFGENTTIGSRFSLPDWVGDKTMIEIVGVVEDAKSEDMRQAAPPTAYVPFPQSSDPGSVTFEVRTYTNPASMSESVRRTIQQADSRIPVFAVRTLAEQVDESLVEERLTASLSSLFGLLALMLASIGVYGLIAHTVARRTNEIGLRMALGAHRGQILSMVMGQTFVLAAAGLSIGIPAAVAASRLVTSELYGVRATDPITLAGAAALMTALIAVAGYLPARRATKVDPMVALRYE
ncbi:MAG TPA: ABC transporter permease [Terriglobia bacterium]|nr:ABC transporter permease [Terriglobia bacterium]